EGQLDLGLEVGLLAATANVGSDPRPKCNRIVEQVAERQRPLVPLGVERLWIRSGLVRVAISREHRARIQSLADEPERGSRVERLLEPKARTRLPEDGGGGFDRRERASEVLHLGRGHVRELSRERGELLVALVGDELPSSRMLYADRNSFARSRRTGSRPPRTTRRRRSGSCRGSTT